MKIKSYVNEHRPVIITAVLFSCFAMYIFYSSSVVYGYTTTPQSDSYLANNVLALIPVAFSMLIGIGSSPFIALAVVSGVGNFLNSGIVDAGNIPFAHILMDLPLSQFNVFVALIIVASIKGVLHFTGVTKILCDATIGKVESIIGILCSVVVPYIIVSAVSIYAAEVTMSETGFLGTAITGILSFLLSLLTYSIYAVIKNLMSAFDILPLVLSPIPGSSFFFTIAKYGFVGTFTLTSIFNPILMSIIGLIILVIAIFLFKWARRLVRYYRKIYIFPFLNSIFRSWREVALMPKRIPRSVKAEFDDIKICIVAFFMNHASPFKKRELCYFVRSGETDYIFKRRLLGKIIKLELASDVYIERCFRFVRIFSDEGSPPEYRKVYAVISREHVVNIEELLKDSGIIDYNIILEERKRIQTAEWAQKKQQFKDGANEIIKDGTKKIKNVFAHFKKK